jgi:protein involved in polysaccharide export with SLBB domain
MIRNIVFLISICTLGLNVFANDSSAILKAKSGYKISKGDVLNVRVLNEPECTVNSPVSSDGNIRLVYLGPTNVAGYTINELEQKLQKDYLQKGIFRNASVIVQIASYKKNFVFLSGSFIRPGPCALPPEATAMNIVELINLAGGFTPIADKKKVVVTRDYYGTDGVVTESKSFEVNVQAMILGNTKIKGQKWWVYPGDQLNVKERLF